MNIAEKPAADAQGRIRYREAIRYLETKYGFDSFDFNGSRHHFTQWCETHGYRVKTATSEARQSLFEEYRRAADGERACPDAENFWHWMVDLVSPPGQGIKLPPTFRLNVPKVLATFDSEVAPKREAQAAALSEKVNSVMSLIPEDIRETAKNQFSVKSAALKPYIRTILGYFAAEFGPVFKLDMRRD
ncbi:hypothetical protein [Burkholderia cenocepacia]|uniref:hypothetical protein n=1 Tax=Burkholderia cenocepacia TaxID=95486 RepID=UPI000760D74E|nr:hypothetical protein [Burkholderia cenocepacia]KWU23353.1 hypothetical protein AS149_37415 [Burkholderia cenocepacia]